jgi:hypothetical protein
MSLLDDSFALIAPSGRAIGTIIPNIVIEEVHNDELVITQHPVERGAAIADHAFKKPSTVEMRCMWSNSTAGTEGYVQDIYGELLALQAQREPFDVYTGKRAYSNMLVRHIRVITDPSSEYALNVVVSLEEVLIADTQQTTQAPQSQQSLPQKTAGIASTGVATASPNELGPTSAGAFSLSGPMGYNGTLPPNSIGASTSGPWGG